MLLTIAEAAAFLRISPKMVRSLINEGRLRRVMIGRHWRVDSEDLDVFVEKCKV